MSATIKTNVFGDGERAAFDLVCAMHEAVQERHVRYTVTPVSCDVKTVKVFLDNIVTKAEVEDVKDRAKRALANYPHDALTVTPSKDVII